MDQIYYILISSLVGMSMILGGLYLCYLEYKFIKNGEVVKGVVEALLPIESVDEDGRRILYKPRFRFRTRDNRIITYESNVSSSHPGVRVGQRVPIVYDRQNPYNSTILTFGYSFGMPWISVCVGMCFCVISIGVYLGYINFGGEVDPMVYNQQAPFLPRLLTVWRQTGMYQVAACMLFGAVLYTTGYLLGNHWITGLTKANES